MIERCKANEDGIRQSGINMSKFHVPSEAGWKQFANRDVKKGLRI